MKTTGKKTIRMETIKQTIDRFSWSSVLARRSCSRMMAVGAPQSALEFAVTMQTYQEAAAALAVAAGLASEIRSASAQGYGATRPASDQARQHSGQCYGVSSRVRSEALRQFAAHANANRRAA